MEELRKKGEDTRMKLIVCQDAERENHGNCVELKSKLNEVQKDLKRTDQAQTATINKVDDHKVLLDTEITQNKELAQEQRYLRTKCIAIDEQHFTIENSLNERTSEMQTLLKQYRILWQEFQHSRDTTNESL